MFVGSGLERPAENLSKAGLGVLVGAIGVSIGLILCGFGLVLFGLNQAGINGVGAVIASLAFLGVAFVLVVRFIFEALLE